MLAGAVVLAGFTDISYYLEIQSAYAKIISFSNEKKIMLVL